MNITQRRHAETRRQMADVATKTDGLGIGEAGQLQPTPQPRPGRKHLVCKRCGQGGYTGEYPFSTLPGSGICDDCL